MKREKVKVGMVVCTPMSSIYWEVRSSKPNDRGQFKLAAAGGIAWVYPKLFRPLTASERGE